MMQKFTIPLPLKVTTNDIYKGMHWAKRKKIVDLYHRELIPYRKNRITGYPVDIAYIFRFKSRPLDTTNCTFMAKMLEDAMVVNGLLEDDSVEYVGSTTIYSEKGKMDEVEIFVS